MQILKKIQKAKKLKALADRGDGGERESAKTFYEDYLKKNNLTENDIEPQHHNRKINIKNKDYEVLLSHVILSVNPFSNINKKRGYYEVLLDDADYIEVIERTNFYYKAFIREKEFLFIAFMDKFKNSFMPDEEAVIKHSEVAKKMAEDAEKLFKASKNNKNENKSKSEILKESNNAPENPTFTQRNLQKIDYFKRLIDNLIYTKANRRLTK